MKKNHELLLSILKDNLQPVSSRELAKQLQVTSRSIKNYISEINSEVPNLIISGPKGYQLNKKIKVDLKKNHVP